MKSNIPSNTTLMSKAFTDYYQLLAIPIESTIDEIKAAYRVLRTDTDSQKSPLAKAKSKLLDEAIDVLCDEDSRAEYDSTYFDNLEKTRVADEPKFKDYSKFRESAKDSWRDIFDTTLPTGKLIESIASQLVILPDAELQIPVLAAYLLIPTSLVSTIPIGFAQGVSGSGKTQIVQLAKQVWGLNLVLTANTTGVALRNDIKDLKYHDPENMAYEKLTHGIVFDDVSIDQFTLNPYQYNLLKAGYRRDADTIKIAGDQGRNLTFRVFGGRFFSSIVPFDSHLQYSELHRRLLSFKTALSSDATVLNPESISWGGLHNKCLSLWESDDDAERFSKLYHSLERSISKGKLPYHSHHASISGGILASGILSGIWMDKDEAIAALGNYWKWIGEKRKYHESATMRELKAFLKIEENDAILRGRNVLFPAQRLNAHITKLSREVALDTLMSVPQLADTMKGLGFRLVDGIWEQNDV
jgi:hypothetical protein